MTQRLTDRELADRCTSALYRVRETFWKHRASGGVYVKVGITLRESDLEPLIRYYPHGKRGFEFCRPIEEFLERFEPTETPTWTGLPL